MTKISFPVLNSLPTRSDEVFSGAESFTIMVLLWQGQEDISMGMVMMTGAFWACAAVIYNLRRNMAMMSICNSI